MGEALSALEVTIILECIQFRLIILVLKKLDKSKKNFMNKNVLEINKIMIIVFAQYFDFNIFYIK